jgi:hypothetical protein
VFACDATVDTTIRGAVLTPETLQSAVELAVERRARLPQEGEWDGPIYGQIGLLAVDPLEQSLQCHACGRRPQQRRSVRACCFSARDG